jgi:hypothetical protein
LIDSTGVGDPIFEDLQREGLAINGFKFSSTSKAADNGGTFLSHPAAEITFPERTHYQRTGGFSVSVTHPTGVEVFSTSRMISR